VSTIENSVYVEVRESNYLCVKIIRPDRVGIRSATFPQLFLYS